jgi:hypothetical protein
MNKLDATGESLESILASIRRSLAEQSTDVLADDSAPPPVSLEAPEAGMPDDEAPPRFLSNGGVDVPRPLEVPTRNEPTFAALEDPPPPAPLSTALPRLENDPPPPAPAAVAAPPQPQEGSQDPLWFLTRPGATDKKNGVPAPMPGAASAQPAPAGVAQPPAAAPKPALKEIVRGPLPPFFGSSPEAAKVEVAPAPPMPTPPMPMPLAGGAVIPPPPAAILRPSEGAPPRGGVHDSPPRASAEPVGFAGPVRAAGGTMREGTPGTKAHSVPVQQAADGAAPPAAGASQLQGLEGMVAELLRPMLRRWLDENMPRLVSAALKAEAENPSRRDAKKP